jgi:hypothetical protein
VPGRHFVCHHCDNRACCNPDHLFLGGQLENIHDMHRKGRGRAKLTPAQVREIRARAGELQRILARDYGVHQTTISRVVCGAGWRMVE